MKNKRIYIIVLFLVGCTTPVTRIKTSNQAVRKPVVQHTGIAAAMLGDLNCDGTFNFDDINPFTLYVSDYKAWQAMYPGCPPINGDMNADGWGNVNDIAAFVSALNGKPQAFLITGRVTDSVTGEGIPGVTIQFTSQVGPNP